MELVQKKKKNEKIRVQNSKHLYPVINIVSNKTPIIIHELLTIDNIMLT